MHYTVITGTGKVSERLAENLTEARKLTVQKWINGEYDWFKVYDGDGNLVLSESSVTERQAETRKEKILEKENRLFDKLIGVLQYTSKERGRELIRDFLEELK